MDERQTETVSRFRSALQFFERYPVTPEPPLLTGMRRQLRQCVDRIKTHEDVQIVVQTSEGRPVDPMRAMLRRNRMIPLARVAAPLLKFAPGSGRALKVPHAHSSAAVVSAAGLRMADFLAGHTKLLRSAGITKDFLSALRQESRALGLAVKQSAAVRRKRSEATAGIKRELKKGLQTLLVMEGLAMLHHSRDTVASWGSLRAVKPKIGRPRTKRPRRARSSPSTLEVLPPLVAGS